MRSLIAASLAAAACAAVEYEIPMTDGTLLHTMLDTPFGFVNGTHKYSAVMERSPYGDNAEELIATVLGTLLGYVAVRQDFRGTGQSAGTFALWHDSAGDAFDTISWIIAQPWSNGEVYTCGVSADGIAEFAMASKPHPNIKSQSIIFATADGWGTFFPGGAYRRALIDGWLKGLLPNNATAEEAVVKAHEQPSFEHWWDLLNGTLYFPNIKFPTVHWAGWYDIFSDGDLLGWSGYDSQSDPSVRGQTSLVVDPLGHCQSGAAMFPNDTIDGRVLLPLLETVDLFNANPPAKRAEGAQNVTFYVMGAHENDASADGNYWTSLTTFPPFVGTPYYLTANGGVDTSAGTAGTFPFTYDPTNPVPTIGGDNLEIACGPLDQSPTESRPDVLVFKGPVLTTPVTLAGPLDAYLWVSSDAVDTDFTIKLIDVYPPNAGNGLANASILIQDGIKRMRWRDAPGVPNPQPMVPGTIYPIKLSLWNTSYIFSPGHAISVHISSSNSPRFLANPNNGLPLLNSSGPNITAHNVLSVGAGTPSNIVLPVVNPADLPFYPIDEDVSYRLAALAADARANGRMGAIRAAAEKALRSPAVSPIHEAARNSALRKATLDVDPDVATLRVYLVDFGERSIARNAARFHSTD